MHTHIHLYVRVYVHMQITCIHMSVRTCIWIYIYTCMHTHIYAYKHKHTHTHTHTCTHVHMHTYIHTHCALENLLYVRLPWVMCSITGKYCNECTSSNPPVIIVCLYPLYGWDSSDVLIDLIQTLLYQCWKCINTMCISC